MKHSYTGHSYPHPDDAYESPATPLGFHNPQAALFKRVKKAALVDLQAQAGDIRASLDQDELAEDEAYLAREDLDRIEALRTEIKAAGDWAELAEALNYSAIHVRMDVLVA